MRVVVFGSPAFAVPTLEALAGDPRFAVALVVSQPDRPSGRGRRSEPPAVAARARALGLPLYQPASLRGEDARRPLAEIDADAFVVAAFGLIFGPATLALPRLGCFNLHASLLPRYRGASPIQAAILCGDDRTGVALMRMERGLDTGAIYATTEAPILAEDTAATLTDRLATAAARLAVAALPRVAGGLQPTPQPEAGASLTRPLTKADGWLDWSQPAETLARQVRALWPWPRAWTTIDGHLLQVHAATTVADATQHREAGLAERRGGDFIVQCGTGALRLDIVLPAGRVAMAGAVFASGRSAAGFRLGLDGAPPPQPPLVRLVGEPAGEG